MKHVFAQTATIDHGRGEIHIDGISLPWAIALPGPTVEQFDSDLPLLTVNIPVFVESAVTVITGEGRREVWDPVLGNVGENARRYVREAFQAAYPDLDVR
jgi:hypothetical protein